MLRERRRLRDYVSDHRFQRRPNAFGDILTMAEKLAIDGGTPVRTKPMPPGNPGKALIGDEEREQVLEVLDAHSPFRFHGTDLRRKADQFEAEFQSPEASGSQRFEFAGKGVALGSHFTRTAAG